MSERAFITTVGAILRGWDDQRCLHCPAALACITGFIDSFGVCEYCEHVIASLSYDGMYFPDCDDNERFKNEIHISTWCPRATITTTIVCIDCCENDGRTPF